MRTQEGRWMTPHAAFGDDPARWYVTLPEGGEIIVEALSLHLCARPAGPAGAAKTQTSPRATTAPLRKLAAEEEPGPPGDPASPHRARGNAPKEGV
jgi:hypothetical protein